jgi:ATP-dependent DNA ligase
MRSNSTAIAWPREISDGQVALLTRSGLAWTAKCPSVVSALKKLRVRSAYINGELCGVGPDGTPSFALTQAATDGSREVQLIFHAFDLLFLDGQAIGYHRAQEAIAAAVGEAAEGH